MRNREYNFFNIVECTQRRQEGEGWQTRNISIFSTKALRFGTSGDESIKKYNPT